MEWKQEEILVTVKAYPEPSKTYRETSCVAGITASGKPVRIFPIPARDLQSESQFRKYSVISARIAKATEDARPESHKIDLDSITEISRLGTGNQWAERTARVEPFRVADSVEELERRFKEKQEDKVASTPSLALIRPSEVLSLKIERRDRDGWNEQELTKLLSPNLFSQAPTAPLEFIPYRFKYEFLCDDPLCVRPHNFSVLDWEMNHTYRKWHRKYGEGEWATKFRGRFEEEFIQRKDLQFFIGTMKNRPYTWSIVGLFYPPSSEVTNLTLPI